MLSLALLETSVAARIEAQRPVSVSEAIAAATTRGPAIVFSTLDTAAGRARITIAKSLGNPILSASYTENTPHEHVDLSLPLDFIFLRRLRLQAAEREVDVLQLQLAFQKAASRYRSRFCPNVAHFGDSLLVTNAIISSLNLNCERAKASSV